MPRSAAGDFVTVATLGRPRGNRGEVTAFALSSHPERYQHLTTVYLFGSGDAYTVERVWEHQGTLIFKFAGVDSISAAELLRGQDVRVPIAERVQLEPGEFFLSDLVGCELRDRASGRVHGMVTGWQEGAGPVLLEIDDGKMLVPFVKAICTGIQPDQRLILVDLPEGLESL